MNATTVSETWNRDAISVTGLSISMGPKQLLTGTDLSVSMGDRVALLGRNGSGKSTLFHWLMSRSADAPWSVYEVAQELAPVAESAVQVVLAAHLERGALWARRTALEMLDRDMTDAEMEEYRQVCDSLTAMKADADEPRARRILHGLGFSATDMERPLREFSGGWRARVALAQGLFMEPDLLLLDEPTNHLDLNGVIWLSEYLTGWRKTLVVISHNVGFVREVATSVWWLTEGRVRAYRCGYDRYLKQRGEEEKKRARDWEALEKQLAALRKKGTPAAKKEAEALAAKRAAEGVTRPPAPYAPKFLFMEGEEERTGALLVADGVSLGYGDSEPILADVTFALHAGCRVALVGANGSGKSTLVRFLAGSLIGKGADGEGVGVCQRPGLRICAFDQHFYHSLPAEATPLEYVRSVGGSTVTVDTVRRILGASGLEGAAHVRPISSLSGGQKARVYFAGIAAQAPDVLLMDEPTNHLDMETVTGLITGLQEFPGAVVVVSHDLEFLEEVVTEVWLTADGRLTRMSEGTDGLSTYVDRVLAEMAE